MGEVMLHPLCVESKWRMGFSIGVSTGTRARVLAMEMSIWRGQPWHDERLTIEARYAYSIGQSISHCA
jgi:hypothetical protein